MRRHFILFTAVGLLALALLSGGGCSLLDQDAQEGPFDVEVVFRADDTLDPKGQLFVSFPWSISPDGQFVTAIENFGTDFEHVVLIATDGRGVLRRLTADFGAYSHAGLSPDGRYAFYSFATGGVNEENLPLSDIMVVDLETGTQRRLGRLDRLEAPYAMSPDNRYLLGTEWMGFGVGGQLRVWDLTQEQRAGKPLGGGRALYPSARFTPDSKAVYANEGIPGRSLVRVDLETDSVHTILQEAATLIDITQDGRHLLVGAGGPGPGGTAWLDVETGTLQYLERDEFEATWDLSPNEQYLLVRRLRYKEGREFPVTERVFIVSVDGTERYELPLKEVGPIGFLSNDSVLLSRLRNDRSELLVARLRPTTP